MDQLICASLSHIHYGMKWALQVNDRFRIIKLFCLLKTVGVLCGTDLIRPPFIFARNRTQKAINSRYGQHFSPEYLDQPGVVANPALGQLSDENVFFPSLVHA